MVNVDINKTKKVMLNYNSLLGEDKKLVDEKISTLWNDVYNSFMEECMNDKELVELHDKLAELSRILKYDITESFETYAYTENEFDPEFAEDVYVYDEKYFNESKYLAENWDAVKAEIQEKIKSLQTSRFVLFKEDKIRNLKIDLKNKAYKVDHYNKCMLLQQQHLDLLENKKTLYDPLEKRYKELLKHHATQVIEKSINSTPSIVCVKHTSTISSSSYPKNFDMRILNDLCNEVHNQTRETIKNDMVDFLLL